MGRGASYEYGGASTTSTRTRHEECEPYAKAKVWVNLSPAAWTDKKSAISALDEPPAMD